MYGMPGGKHWYTRSLVSFSVTPCGPCDGFAAFSCSWPHAVIGGSPFAEDEKSYFVGRKFQTPVRSVVEALIEALAGALAEAFAGAAPCGLPAVWLLVCVHPI